MLAILQQEGLSTFVETTILLGGKATVVCFLGFASEADLRVRFLKGLTIVKNMRAETNAIMFFHY